MKNIIKEVIPYVVILIIVILIRSFLVTPITVVGDSMYPNLKDGELLLLSKISYKISDISRFDIVVIDNGDEEIIKRIIGLPNEYILYEDNKLYVNGKLVSEEYEHGVTQDFNLVDICMHMDNKDNCSYDKIPDNYYLVLGDNRGISKDSRSIGLIHASNIVGKAIFRFYPLNRIGGV